MKDSNAYLISHTEVIKQHHKTGVHEQYLFIGQINIRKKNKTAAKNSAAMVFLRPIFSMISRVNKIPGDKQIQITNIVSTVTVITSTRKFCCTCPQQFNIIISVQVSTTI
jgi:hypothetical protein